MVIPHDRYNYYHGGLRTQVFEESVQEVWNWKASWRPLLNEEWRWSAAKGEKRKVGKRKEGKGKARRAGKKECSEKEENPHLRKVL